MTTHQPKKLIYFLPNSFTCLNMACGFAAVLIVLQGNFYHSCLLLILGGIFDSVDGRIARLTGTSSSFGEQFDSMSDLVTFGMAPSLIFYMKFLIEYKRLGMVLAFIFLLCGALRLARFNANIDRVNADYFQGLPIPITALGLVGLILWDLRFPEIAFFKQVSPLYIFALSILMISNFPFPSFKNSQWVKTHKKRALLAIFLLFCLFSIYEKIMMGVYFSIYIFTSLIYYFTHLKKFKGIFSGEKGPDKES